MGRIGTTHCAAFGDDLMLDAMREFDETERAAPTSWRTRSPMSDAIVLPESGAAKRGDSDGLFYRRQAPMREVIKIAFRRENITWSLARCRVAAGSV